MYYQQTRQKRTASPHTYACDNPDLGIVTSGGDHVTLTCSNVPISQSSIVTLRGNVTLIANACAFSGFLICNAKQITLSDKEIIVSFGMRFIKQMNTVLRCKTCSLG